MDFINKTVYAKTLLFERLNFLNGIYVYPKWRHVSWTLELFMLFKPWIHNPHIYIFFNFVPRSASFSWPWLGGSSATLGLSVSPSHCLRFLEVNSLVLLSAGLGWTNHVLVTATDFADPLRLSLVPRAWWRTRACKSLSEYFPISGLELCPLDRSSKISSISVSVGSKMDDAYDLVMVTDRCLSIPQLTMVVAAIVAWNLYKFLWFVLLNHCRCLISFFFHEFTSLHALTFTACVLLAATNVELGPTGVASPIRLWYRIDVDVALLKLRLTLFSYSYLFIRVPNSVRNATGLIPLVVWSTY